MPSATTDSSVITATATQPGSDGLTDDSVMTLMSLSQPQNNNQVKPARGQWSVVSGHESGDSALSQQW